MQLTYDNFYQLLNLDHSDLLLLKNLFSSEEKKAETCNSFLESVVIGDADSEIQALMPFFLHRNIQAYFDSGRQIRLKDIFRQVMGNNSMNVSEVLPLIKAFNQVNIPVLLLKGLALGHVYYKGLALRAMGDVDIAVPVNHFDKGLQIARSIGAKQVKSSLHSVDFILGRNVALDFHCSVFKENYEQEKRETILWERARQIDFYGASAFVLCPEHLLLGILINAFIDTIHETTGKTRMIKWIVDLAVILEQKPDFDLDLFIQDCYHFRLMPQVICLLRAYQTTFCYKLGDYLVDDIVRRLENEKEYNQARMKLFDKLGTCYRNPPLFSIRKKFLDYLYLSDNQTSNLTSFKIFIYKKYHAENFCQYLRATWSRAINNLKNKHNNGGSVS